LDLTTGKEYPSDESARVLESGVLFLDQRTGLQALEDRKREMTRTDRSDRALTPAPGTKASKIDIFNN
jgi:hypothetical protein